MQLINISLILAASVASTVQARHAVGPHLHPRQHDNETYPATSTIVVSPLPVSSVPMGTGVSSVADAMTTKVTNATLTYAMGSGSSTTVITTTVMRTETLNRTHTVYATKEAGGAAKSGGQSYTNAATSVAADAPGEPTTTVTNRSTTTRTVTVESVGASGGNVLAAQTTDSVVGDYGATSVAGKSASATGSACAAVATVTETIKSTITVTASPSTAASPEASSTEDAGSATASSSMPILSTGSVALYNNGTAASPTESKKKCASSGFLTKSKPTTLPSGYRRF